MARAEEEPAAAMAAVAVVAGWAVATEAAMVEVVMAAAVMVEEAWAAVVMAAVAAECTMVCP